MTPRPAAAPMADAAAGPSPHETPGLRYAAGRLARSWRRTLGGTCAVCRGWCADGLCPWCAARFAHPRPRCPTCALPVAPHDDPSLAAPAPAPAPSPSPSPSPSHAHAHAPSLTPTHAHTAAPCARCRRQPPPWTRAITGVDYGYPWDRLLADLKFHERLDAIEALLRPLRAALQGRVDAGVRVLAVPLARERLRQRGYNQAWELARRLARAQGLAAAPDAMFRVRDTGHQLGLQREQRAANLRDAFVVAPRRAAWVRGADLALVDDVLTTGATARSATRTLLAAGARTVQVWTVARTPEL